MAQEYRVVSRFPDQRPHATDAVSRDGAEKHFRLVAGSGRAVWVELQSRPRGGAWTVVEWRGVRLVDVDGRPVRRGSPCPS